MSLWDGCPASLFDLYIEVGEIKPISRSDCDCSYVDVWIGSSVGNASFRQECANVQRRPIWTVFKQILKLSKNKEVCLVFMCDDIADWGNDTEEWSRSIYLLLEELKNRKKLAGSVLFTRKTGEQIRQRSQSSDFRREKDRNEYIALYKTLDVLVTQQANRYASAEKRSVFYASEEAGVRLSWLLDPTK